MNKCVNISKNNPSIVFEKGKCDNCGICSNICSFNVGVYGFSNDKNPCINCGSCSIICPMKCISERDETYLLRDYLHSGKVIVFQVAPAARISIGEEFGVLGINMEKKLVSALKLIGGDYVFDTTFGADLTTVEEANELLERINNKKNGPMLTSCCPSWVKFVEVFYHEFIDNLSTCKSPISMQSSIIKNYFSKKINVDKNNIVVIAIAPCTAKKMERIKHDDTDLVITVRELAKYLKEEKINITKLFDSNFDSLMSKGSGAGHIFGASGGVMEATMREVYYILNKRKPKGKLVNFKEIRGLSNIKEANVKIKNRIFKVAVINGTGDARKILEKIKDKKVDYDFIEVMACEGGCVSGGGQPRVYSCNNSLKLKRINGLYNSNKKMKIKNASSNPDIKRIYKEFLCSPLNEESIKHLHTSYKKRDDFNE